MGSPLIVQFSNEEIEILLDDQIAFLESNHIGQIEECGERKDCPIEHFGIEAHDEFHARINLINKLETAQR
jgi:hypothetical protein